MFRDKCCTSEQRASACIYKFDIFVVIYEMFSKYVTEIKYTSELLDKNDMLFRGKIKLPRHFWAPFFHIWILRLNMKKFLCKFHSLVAILGFEAAFLVWQNKDFPECGRTEWCSVVQWLCILYLLFSPA